MDAFDLEVAADWRGEPGKLAEALERMRWLDKQGRSGGKTRYQLHDWAEHQPWVIREPERRDDAARGGHVKNHVKTNRPQPATCKFCREAIETAIAGMQAGAQLPLYSEPTDSTTDSSASGSAGSTSTAVLQIPDTRYQIPDTRVFDSKRETISATSARGRRGAPSPASFMFLADRRRKFDTDAARHPDPLMRDPLSAEYAAAHMEAVGVSPQAFFALQAEFVRVYACGEMGHDLDADTSRCTRCGTRTGEPS